MKGIRASGGWWTRVEARLLVCVVGALCACSGDHAISVHARSPVEGRPMQRQPLLTAALSRSDATTPCHFELSTDSTLGEALVSGPIAPDSGRATWKVPEELVVGMNYYWRVGIETETGMAWDSVRTFVGGPELHAFPNPFCCKAAKIHKKVTVDGIVPPAQVGILDRSGKTVYQIRDVNESSAVWPVTYEDGTTVPPGMYTIVVIDALGSHTINLRATPGQ